MYQHACCSSVATGTRRSHMRSVSVAYESRKRTKLLMNCLVLYVLQGSEEPPKLCLYLQHKCSIPPQVPTLKDDDWVSCSGQQVLTVLTLRAPRGAPSTCGSRRSIFKLRLRPSFSELHCRSTYNKPVLKPVSSLVSWMDLRPTL